MWKSLNRRLFLYICVVRAEEGTGIDGHYCYRTELVRQDSFSSVEIYGVERKCRMRLKNIMLVVEDIERSKAFYREVFGLLPVRQFEGNVILTEGLVLQERNAWEQLIGRETALGQEACVRQAESVLYFETPDLEAFQQKLDDNGREIPYLCRLTTYDWGQKAIRFYDPDGHLIEIGEAN